MANADLIIQGSSDNAFNELTTNGVVQAHKLAQRLIRYSISDDVVFERVYCSNLKRSQQTAEIIAKDLDLEIDSSAFLREVSRGRFENMRIDLACQDPEWVDWFSGKPQKEGETYLSVMQRVRSFFHRETIQSYIKDTKRHAIIIVGHCLTNAVIRAYVENLPVAAQTPQDHCDIFCLRLTRHHLR